MIAPRLWQGEREVSALSALDRGLVCADGVFETIRVIGGRPVLLEQHWARLSAGCAVLGLPDLAFWRQAVTTYLQDIRAASPGHGVLKIVVTRGPGERGYLPPVAPQPTLVLTWQAQEPAPDPRVRDGVRVADAAFALAEQPLLAGIKHLARLEQVLLRQALAQQHPDCAEAVVQDRHGRLVEGVFSNLFLVRDGVLMTPALQRCGVRGVLRDALLDACVVQGISALVSDLGPEDLLQADECFFANSVFGIWPVTAWRNRTWRVGEMTRQCQALISPWFAEQ